MSNLALVTGANRGIGLAIAKGLAEQGMQVLLGARDLKQGEQAAKSIKGDVTAVAFDVTDQEKLQKQLASILKDYPDITVLVNNAGILREGNALRVSNTDFYESMQVNAFGAYHTMRALLPGMQKAGYGRIVNVSSGWGSMNDGLTGPTAYSVSKATLNALTLNFSHAISGNIKVNSICPGWVRTDMGGSAASRSPEEGADTAIWLATLPEDGPSGKFFRDRQEIEW